MTSYWDKKLDDPVFRKELAKWDRKLKASGFVDVEQRLECGGREGDYLTGSPSSGDLRRGLYKEETEEYYTLARQHLHTMKWRSAKDTGRRTVWRMHSEGIPTSVIHRTMGEKLGFGIKKIQGIIRKERAKMHRRREREIDEA